MMQNKLRLVSGLLAVLLLFSAAGCRKSKSGTESSDVLSGMTESDSFVSDSSDVSSETPSSGASNGSATSENTSGLTPSKVDSLTSKNFYDDIRGTTVKIAEDNSKEIRLIIKAFEERYGARWNLPVTSLTGRRSLPYR